MALRPEHSSDLLIDGKLVPGSGGTFDVVNPATEEVIGQAADATSADLDAAIGAARRAFDTTDWARDHAFRAKCLRQLRDALLAHADEFKELTTAEVGAPAFLTGGPHFAGPAEDLGWFADLAESFEWTRDLGKAKPMGIPN
ncbi:MAG: aldehyde dehydrogenase family protein, partial [Gordonia sp. (in: high G+C Gram-positive bacteria)]